jgi:hypothetical protein
LLSEPQTIGTSTKEDLETLMVHHLLKLKMLEIHGYTLATSKEKKVFTKDEFQEQLIFYF